jgi:hypothetical protein
VISKVIRKTSWQLGIMTWSLLQVIRPQLASKGKEALNQSKMSRTGSTKLLAMMRKKIMNLGPSFIIFGVLKNLL